MVSYLVTSYYEKQLVCLVDSKTFWRLLLQGPCQAVSKVISRSYTAAKTFLALSKDFRSEPLPGLRCPKFGTVLECGDMSPLSMRGHVHARQNQKSSGTLSWLTLKLLTVLTNAIGAVSENQAAEHHL